MATTPELTKGVPRVEGNPEPALRGDHNALADWARDNVDRSVANNAARDALAVKWVGQRVHTADTFTVWLCTDPAGSGTWMAMHEDTGWQTPSLLNSWVAVGGYAAPGYRRMNRRVYLRGMVGSGTINNIFLLPVGYRVPAQRFFLVAANVGGLQIFVKPDGNVTAVAYIASGTNTLVGLDGISFEVD